MKFDADTRVTYRIDLKASRASLSREQTMKIVGEVVIAGGSLRTDFESASRIKIAPRYNGTVWS